MEMFLTIVAAISFRSVLELVEMRPVGLPAFKSLSAAATSVRMQL